MLTSLTLKDYTTFITETTFDFKTTNYKILEKSNTSNKILKGALFVGENASGKTQTLKAIIFLLDFLLGNKDINFIEKKSMYTKGTKFSLKYSFQIEKDVIKYEVEFEENKINRELLYINDVLIIDRIKNNGIVMITKDKRIVEVDEKLSLLKQEYYKTKFENNQILNNWFNYLKNSIYVNCLTGETKVYNSEKMSEQVLEKLVEKEGTTKINDFLNKLGYNSEIVYLNKFENESMIINSEKNVIGIKKKGTNVALPIMLEATGNRKLMNVITPINYATNNECMLILDEFSSGLHNELEEALIKYFFNNSKSSQIFFASHSTNLLDTYLLRPDQIYSFEFDKKLGTIIKRFSEENPRESQNMEKMFLNGVFNGKPNYNKEFKN